MRRRLGRASFESQIARSSLWTLGEEDLHGEPRRDR